MTTYLNTLLTFISHHPELAYGLIFLISLSESLALVGLLVPGTVIMFGVGAVVATGSLNLFPVLLMAMIGAIAGDGVSYWLGHHYKEKLVNIWPFSRHPGMLNKGEAFFHRHGVKSVLFGRFVGPVRPMIPVVAGMLGMHPVRFSVVNVLSAIGWALVYILPGVFFGASLALAGTVSTRLAVLVLILVAGIWSLIWISTRTLSLLDRKGPAVFAVLKQWTTTELPHQGTVPRLFKRTTSILIFSKQGEELLFAFLTLLLFAAGWGFFGVLQDVMAKDPLVVADQAVYHFLQSLRTPWVDNAFVGVTELGDSFVNIALFCTVLLVLLVKRCRRAATFWALAALGGLLGVQLLKWAIHLPRPVAIYHGASAYGFPSGHTTMSVILYGFLAILLARRLTGAWRLGLFSSVVLISFVIGFSRLYLGAHWLSDVLGGYFVGTSWTAFMGIAWLKGADDEIPRRLLASTVVLVIAIAGSWHVVQKHEKDLAFYAPRHPMRNIALTSWQADVWRDLPAWRVDMEGEPEQPLTVQWAGSPDELSRFLMSKGWRRPLPMNPKSFLGMFAPGTPIEQLPVLPLLHDGKVERLRLVRTGRGVQRLVLRLWSADVKINGKDTPLFVGTIEEQQGRSLAGLITMAKDTGNYERPLHLLEQTLGGTFKVRLVHRADRETRTVHEHQGTQWSGGVLLADQVLTD
ncbi:MAG: VTT domain-containing protein [Syntrophales bacterium]|jgi:undecaprenyl-diphosphatase|uniref:Membrane protein n=2 Tax=Desulforhabdus amnigena TaxID=40218 RepID=A0A9W6D201_9BACT|nr:VTT domain-containing protein [Syntrophales bacterium]GLI32772.1 membrane protein [Desulforhabdus amnigena]